ncbi:MAG: hypothetical protein WAM95_17095 [Bacillus sp. (in: firmicutes)]
MDNQTYFYQFLEPISKELAFFARELENSIFTGPRTMLTHARIFVENTSQQVMQAEKLTDQQWTSLKEGTKPHMIQDRSAILKRFCHGNQYIKL